MRLVPKHSEGDHGNVDIAEPVENIMDERPMRVEVERIESQHLDGRRSELSELGCRHGPRSAADSEHHRARSLTDQ